MIAKLARWLIFSLAFSLIPLGVDSIAELIRTDGTSAGFGRHGELYLLASAMCAVGLGEMIGVNQKFAVFKITAGGAAVVIVSFATALYTLSASDAAATLVHQVGAPNSTSLEFYKTLLTHSWMMFACACVVSTSCIALSEVK